VESVFILLLIPSLPFRFADFPDPFDLILSVGVLQIMKGELLKSTLSSLARYSKIDGRFYLIRLPKVFNKRELRGRLNLTRIQETLRFPLRVTTSRTQ
jgi:cyclopropane fatty-acyl-phospholipid synthase-like methyltransferase